MTSAQVSKGCSNKIQLQSPPPPAPTRTNTAQCSNHCNLRKGMPCALMQVAVIVDIYACINITLHAIAIYIVCSDNVCTVRTRLSLIWYRGVTVSHHISGRGSRGLWSSCSSYKKRKVCAQGRVLQSSHIRC